MNARDYARILSRLSPDEQNMLRDIDNGTTYGRTEHGGQMNRTRKNSAKAEIGLLAFPARAPTIANPSEATR